MAARAEAAAKVATTAGMEGMMDAMYPHPGDAAVQGHGCRSFAALATINRGARAKIVAKGGVDVAIKAARTHPGHAKVQSH